MAPHPATASGPGERRSSARHALVGDAVLTTAADQIVSARVCNLSLGGCCLEVPSGTIELGSAVHVRFDMSGTAFELHGRVANVQAKERVGIQFASTETSGN